MKHFDVLTKNYSREEVGLLVEAFVEDLSFWNTRSSRSKEAKQIIERIASDGTKRKADARRKKRNPQRRGNHQNDGHSGPLTPETAQEPMSNWRTAVDPMSRKIYYYDTITRRTQWEKVGGIQNVFVCMRSLLEISSATSFLSPKKSSYWKRNKSVNSDENKRCFSEKWKRNYWIVWPAVR